MILHDRQSQGTQGQLEGSSTAVLRAFEARSCLLLLSGKPSKPLFWAIYGDKVMLKVFRKVELGINPDLEIGRFLVGRDFPNVPAFTGALEYTVPSGDSRVAIAYGCIRDAKTLLR